MRLRGVPVPVEIPVKERDAREPAGAKQEADAGRAADKTLGSASNKASGAKR